MTKIQSVELTGTPNKGYIDVTLDHSVDDNMKDKRLCMTHHHLKEDDFYDILRTIGMETNPCPVMQLIDKEKFDRLFYAIIDKEQTKIKSIASAIKEKEDAEEE
jgi:hypothetical protein